MVNAYVFVSERKVLLGNAKVFTRECKISVFVSERTVLLGNANIFESERKVLWGNANVFARECKVSLETVFCERSQRTQSFVGEQTVFVSERKVSWGMQMFLRENAKFQFLWANAKFHGGTQKFLQESMYKNNYMNVFTLFLLFLISSE